MNADDLMELISRKLSALLALSLLPEPEKMSLADKVVLLTRFGLSNQEVAGVLGTTKGTVKVLKSRAGTKGR